MNKNLYTYPRSETATMTTQERSDLRMLLALPDSIGNLEKSVEGASGAEKDRLRGLLESNVQEYERLMSLYEV